MGVGMLEPTLPLWMLDTMDAPNWQQGLLTLILSIEWAEIGLMGSAIYSMHNILSVSYSGLLVCLKYLQQLLHQYCILSVVHVRVYSTVTDIFKRKWYSSHIFIYLYLLKPVFLT